MIDSGQESQTIEWKWSWQDDYLKWLCGYANTNGGTLYIGVNDDGYVVGVENSKKMLESLPNKINDTLGILADIQVYSAAGAENICYGNAIPQSVSEKLINQYAAGKISFETMDISDKRYQALKTIQEENKIWESEAGIREYLAIQIVRYPFAISCSGKYYKRAGSTLHELNGLELQNFLLERAGKTWDAVPIQNVSVDDLSKEALDAFRKKAVKSRRMTENEVNVPDELLLRNLKLYDGQYLTRAAVLLFHPEPEQFVTGAYIKIGYFSPVGVFGENMEPIEDLQYQDTVEGPLILQADRAMELIFSKYMKALIDYDGLQRVETTMLTGGIVRELLLNAINHKLYETGVPIQISVYEDHLEIFNMGEWPKRLPADTRIYDKHESVPRNPKIADVAFRSGDVEAWGRGFLKIKAECSQIGAPLPIIDAENGGVSVRADACRKYLHLLNKGQYGQVGANGKWYSVVKENAGRYQVSAKGKQDKTESRQDSSKNEQAKLKNEQVKSKNEQVYEDLLAYLAVPRTRQEIADYTGYRSRNQLKKKILSPLLDKHLIQMTHPDKPNSPKQKYVRKP